MSNPHQPSDQDEKLKKFIKDMGLEPTPFKELTFEKLDKKDKADQPTEGGAR